MAQASTQPDERAWELFVELRKEIVQSQQIRAQVIGFKITFIGTAVGVILANASKIPPQLLVVPAFAAVFFDFLIQSYSFSIKRLGRYCGENLEPIFAAGPFRSWQDFVSDPANRESYSGIGNLGITFLAAIPAIIALAAPFRWMISAPLLLVLILLLVLDWLSFFSVGRYGRRETAKQAELEKAIAAKLPPA